MGSKGSKNAPDPRLVDAQLKSMRNQDDATASILKTAEEFAPLQKQQLQFGLDAAKQAYADSQADRAWMVQRRDMLTGAQNDIANEANTFDTEAKREELAGQAMSDINRGFDAAEGQQIRALNASGVNPSSGAALALREDSKVQKALALAGGANMARTGARAEGRALKGRVADMLAGYPSMASAQTGAGAGYGTAGVGLSSAGLAGRTAGFGQAAGIAGQMGSNAAGLYGIQQQAQTAAQGQRNEMIGTLLGAGMTAGAMYA